MTNLKWIVAWAAKHAVSPAPLEARREQERLVSRVIASARKQNSSPRWAESAHRTNSGDDDSDIGDVESDDEGEQSLEALPQTVTLSVAASSVPPAKLSEA